MSRSHSWIRTAIAAMLLGIVFAAPPLQAKQPKGKTFALLVGVKDYDHPKLKSLKFTENDAVEVAGLLKGAGYEVVLLTTSAGQKNASAKPTLANIEQQLKSLLAKCKKGDTILVGLAGHGLQFDKVEDSYFVPQDGIPFNDEESVKTLLSLQNVYKQLDGSFASVKLMLVDACRNDPNAGRGVNGQGARPPSGVAALFSCSAGERAYEVNNYRHGIFFYHILEGLKGKAKTTDEDEVTWDSLQAYVRKKVALDAPKLLGEEVHQTPSLNAGELSGESPVLIGGKQVPLAVRARLSAQFNLLERSTVERLPLGQRAQVLFVVPGGGGAEMGLQSGDIVRRINGQDAQTAAKAKVLLDGLKMGDPVELEVSRTQQTLKLTGRYQTPLTNAEEFRRTFELAEKDDPAAQNYLGYLYESGQYMVQRGKTVQEETEAAKWYQKAAVLGNSYAQTSLAEMYTTGRGVEKNETEALKWYRKAAVQGIPVAQNHLGISYQSGRGVTKNETEAAKWYRKAAEQGYVSAQFNLGSLYSNGLGVQKNDTEAVKWFRLAADQGSSGAQNDLGHCYLTGRGVTKNETEALNWFRKAGDQGQVDACNHLGGAYLRGRGVTKNEGEAAKYYQLAAERGHVEAQANLGWMYGTGRGLTRDETEAVKWYRKAAEKGNTFAQNNLGECYAGGHGTPQNDKEAVKWYRSAAEKGNISAQTHLGFMYGQGRGVPKSEKEAAKWYRSAAEQGNGVAQYNLGLCYANGRGVQKNRVTATLWLRKAAAQGNSNAVVALKRLQGPAPTVKKRTVIVRRR